MVAGSPDRRPTIEKLFYRLLMKRKEEYFAMVGDDDLESVSSKQESAMPFVEPFACITRGTLTMHAPGHRSRAGLTCVAGASIANSASVASKSSHLAVPIVGDGRTSLRATLLDMKSGVAVPNYHRASLDLPARPISGVEAPSRASMSAAPGTGVARPGAKAYASRARGSLPWHARSSSRGILVA